MQIVRTTYYIQHRKLKYRGHIARAGNLCKTIPLGKLMERGEEAGPVDDGWMMSWLGWENQSGIASERQKTGTLG